MRLIVPALLTPLLYTVVALPISVSVAPADTLSGVLTYDVLLSLPICALEPYTLMPLAFQVGLAL